MKSEQNNNWPSFDLKSWDKVNVISGKVASEEEAKNGLAVFCLKDVGESHRAVEMELPRLAYLNDSENNSQELVVVVQAESSDKGEIVGYRNPNGGNGACFFYELTFLSEQEIKTILT